MTTSTTPIVVPGSTLGSASEYISGSGTYERDGTVYAALVGTQSIKKSEGDERQTIEVIPPRHSSRIEVPRVGDIVMGRITKISLRQAVMEVLFLEQKQLKDAYAGVIRKEDARSTDIDNVQIVNCFRPGDIVRAKVISLGDVRSYYLSTAADDLGVVFAKSEGAGELMIPVSAKEMQCPSTKTKELRKVARISSIA